MIKPFRKHLTVSISSWFCLPEQGMRDFEILSRGSAFVVPSNNPQFEKKYHLLTASHLVAPWRFPKYYPDEWLRHVNESHTFYTVEIRHTDGMFLCVLDLDAAAYHHKSRDMAILHLENEQESMDTLKNFEFQPLTLANANDELQANDELYFHGHEVVGALSTNGEDERKPFPRIVPGTVLGRKASGLSSQIFSQTVPTLTIGMCGGPVTRRVDLGSEQMTMPTIAGLPNFKATAITTPAPRVAYGLLEGIVPADGPVQDVRNCAVFVEPPEIASFVEAVENFGHIVCEKGTPVSSTCPETEISFLHGGEAELHVGRDQDPAKMDIQRIIQELEQQEPANQPALQPDLISPDGQFQDAKTSKKKAPRPVIPVMDPFLSGLQDTTTGLNSKKRKGK